MRKHNPIYKRALMLAVPMMIQNGITNMVSLVDNIMVGSQGTEAMTAVSIAGQLIFVFNLAIFGALAGPGIYGAQYYGQRNMHGFQSTFRIKLWLSLACLIGGLLVFLLRDESFDRAIPPRRKCHRGLRPHHDLCQAVPAHHAAGAAVLVVTQVYATSLRETGSSVKPMVGGVASVVVDIVLNYLLIYGNCGMPKLGVRGAAIATVLARVTEMSIVIIWAHLCRNKHVFLKGIYRTLRVPKELAGKVLRKGMPIFCNELLWSAGLAALTQCYSTRGLEVVAGLNISNAICNLLNVVFVALGSAVGILIGQTLGASEYEKAKKDSFSLMWFTGAVCLLLAAILISVSGVFPKAYDTTAEVRNYGRWFITITAVFFPIQGFLNACTSPCVSGGKTMITFLFDSVFTWVIPIPAALLMCHFTSLPILGIYAIVQAADILKVVIGYILIQKGVWISNLVEEMQ